MKFWGVVVVVFYVLIFLVVMIPLLAWLLPVVQPGMTWWQDLAQRTRDMFFPFQDNWQVWAFLGVILLAQAAFLSVPVDMASKRPLTKRTIVPLVIATSLMMGLLGAGVALAISETLRKGVYDTPAFWVTLGVFLLMWAFWARIFSRWSQKTGPEDLVSRQCRALFKGSILELLVVVPAHILARHRDYCCAGFQTFIGIAFGVSVMLFAFGPGIFFLFAGQLRHLRKKQESGQL